MTALEDSLQHMLGMVTHNNDLYAKGFHLQDGHLWVLKRIQEDIITGKVKMLVPNDPPLEGNGINYSAYYAAFNEHSEEQYKKFQAEKALLRDAKQAKDPDPAESASEEANTTYPVVEFGGDANGATP